MVRVVTPKGVVKAEAEATRRKAEVNFCDWIGDGVGGLGGEGGCSEGVDGVNEGLSERWDKFGCWESEHE